MMFLLSSAWDLPVEIHSQRSDQMPEFFVVAAFTLAFCSCLLCCSIAEFLSVAARCNWSPSNEYSLPQSASLQSLLQTITIERVAALI